MTISFIKSATKASLLALVKNPLDSRGWARLLEAMVTKDELVRYVGDTSDTIIKSTKKTLSDDYVRRDGTKELTADWDAGAFEIRAQTLESDVATGTTPLTVASTTKVTNLNSDQLDSQTGTYYLDSDNFTGTEWTDLTDSGDTTIHKHDVYVLHSLADAESDFLVASGNDVFVKKTLAETGAILEADIDHGNIQGLDSDDHAIYSLADGTRDYTGTVTIATGDLYIDDASNPAIYLRHGGSETDYSVIYDDNSGVSTRLRKYTNSTAAALHLEPYPSSGSDLAIVALFRQTNTSAGSEFRIHKGNNTSDIQHLFNGYSGTVDICQYAGNVTIGGTAGASKLTVVGSITLPVTTHSSATLTLTAAHYTVLCDASSNTVTISLPTASGITGRIYNIKCIDATYACTIDPSGSEEIDGDSTSMTLDLMEVVTVQSDGTNWWII